MNSDSVTHVAMDDSGVEVILVFDKHDISGLANEPTHLRFKMTVEMARRLLNSLEGEIGDPYEHWGEDA